MYLLLLSTFLFNAGSFIRDPNMMRHNILFHFLFILVPFGDTNFYFSLHFYYFFPVLINKLINYIIEFM